MASSSSPFRAFISLAVVVLVVGAIYMYFSGSRVSEQGVAHGASVSFVEGVVEYQDLAGDWHRVETGDNLEEGNAVETFGSSRAIISLDDGSAVRLNNDTKITLASLDPNNIEIINEAGEVYTRVVELDRIFTVTAGEVVYESLGTAYKTTYKDSKNGVDVYEKSVKVKYADKEVVVDQDKKYYVKDDETPDNAEKVLDISTEEKAGDEFYKWNSEKDVEWSEKQTEETPEVAGEITLYGSVTENGVEFSWDTMDLDASKGFKVVKSTEMDPEYPGSDYVYLDDPEVRSYTWELMDGETYYFRVCQYLGGDCGVYSNNVKLTVPEKVEEEEKEEETKTEETTTTSEYISISSSGSKISWSTNFTSTKGYKLVWSKNTYPTYPTRSGDKYQYYSSSSTRSGSVSAFDGTGTYYVRVCEYLSGSCGVYSNQITVYLEGESKETEKETETSEAVSSISLSGSGSTVKWTVDGYSKSGFKVVWSKTSSPTYPTRSTDSYQYYSSPNTSSSTLNAFDGDGTYYVRVCEYLGGQCGVYSNQITLELTK